MADNFASTDSSAVTEVVATTKLEAKFVVVGDAGVGKTAFVDRLLFGASTAVYLPTLLDSYSGTCHVEFVSSLVSMFKKFKRFPMTLLDTSGAHDFRRISNPRCRGKEEARERGLIPVRAASCRVAQV